MSADGDSGPGRREVAYRLFAAEFDDASLSYSESDEERAPNYVVTPTGLRVNRLFAVGVVTEVESINEDTLRGRIVDPTGAFVTYAGQYQPEAHAFLDGTTPPAFVAITGKARTFEPEDSDRVFTSVRPESLSEVDSDTRDRWVVSAAQSTLHRIAVCAAALDSGLRGETLETALMEAGVDDSLAGGIPRALDHYETTTAYLEGLRQLAVDALELVADERDEVRSLDLAPGEGGDSALGALPSVDIELAAEPTPAAEPESEPAPEAAAEETATEPVASSETATDSVGATTETEETSADTVTDTPATTAADSADTAPTESEAVDEGVEGEPDLSAAESTETVDAVSSVEPDSEAANGASEPDATADAASDDADDEETLDEAGMYQLEEEEREELESEFGAEFSSGNEVDPAGEADIDVPDADELAEKAEAEAGTETEGTATEPTTDETTDDELGEFDSGLGDFEDDSPSAAEPASDDEPGAADTEPVADDDTAAADDTASTDEPPATDNTAESPSDAAASSESEPETDEPPAEDIDLEETVVGMMAEMDGGDGVDRAELVVSVVDTYGVDDAAVEEAIDDALMGGRCYEPGEGVLKAI